jgi:hypothetical protein
VDCGVNITCIGIIELKGPTHEIFESGFFTQIRPVRVDDLGLAKKNESLQVGVFI